MGFGWVAIDTFSFFFTSLIKQMARNLFVWFVTCGSQDCLEGALVATHQEMETYPAQPLAREKLLLKKESLQNQLINIRGELSQASSVRKRNPFIYTDMHSQSTKKKIN